MMKRILYGLLGILFAIVTFVIFHFTAVSMQPLNAAIQSSDENISSNYITPDSIYHLEGDMDCFPGVSLMPIDIDTYTGAKTTINSLSEIRDSKCISDKSYVATIRFYISVPTGFDYSMIMPGTFCEYIVFINGSIAASTKTYFADKPAYPGKKIVDFPAASDSAYEIVISAVTPVNSIESTTPTILFGPKEKIHSVADNSLGAVTIIVAIIIVSIIITAIQFLGIKRERLLTSYIILCIAVLIRIIFTGDAAVTAFFENISYKTGTIIFGLTMPMVILAVIYHSYCLFPSLFNTKITTVVCTLQILPFLNILTLRSIRFLNLAAPVAYTAAFTLCYYAVFKAHMRKYTNSVLHSLGLLIFSISGLLTVSTANLPVAIHFPEFYPFAAFTIVEIIILAKKFTDQENAEQFYTQKLTKTLETMQDSENAFLNAQMKPHFLYNTLNTIADLCVSDPDKARNLIKTLTDYLKLILSIDNMEKTVPLSQEMELASSYTAIEKERFPSINFYTDFPIRMPKVDMPPLTLQPLIENAIKHGVRKSDRPGAVTLRIRDTYDSVTFYVSDNGVGMDEATINKLFVQPKENKSIGVYNIDKRLHNLYGTGLEVDSTVGLGTCISFTVPK